MLEVKRFHRSIQFHHVITLCHFRESFDAEFFDFNQLGTGCQKDD